MIGGCIYRIDRRAVKMPFHNPWTNLSVGYPYRWNAPVARMLPVDMKMRDVRAEFLILVEATYKSGSSGDPGLITVNPFSQRSCRSIESGRCTRLRVTWESQISSCKLAPISTGKLSVPVLTSFYDSRRHMWPAVVLASCCPIYIASVLSASFLPSSIHFLHLLYPPFIGIPFWHLRASAISY